MLNARSQRNIDFVGQANQVLVRVQPLNFRNCVNIGAQFYARLSVTGRVLNPGAAVLHERQRTTQNDQSQQNRNH
jgi:hypothetical protein